ncbi:MAG: lytic transglycosylase domain-containing protein [Candidatus Gastranaerophilales bacterium]|nr:lytic transglycosylase domain-containing protein [Candidatus Gastranaerophilales bacterium]
MIKKSLLNLIMIITVLIFSNLTCQANQNVSANEIKAYIIQCAAEMGVEPEIVLGIAKQESGFCQNKRSAMGAVGVFQIMPSTARKIGFNPYHYKDNIRGGISYYKQLKKMFKTDELALAAYNAGPGNVKRYGGVPPFAETKKFIRIVMGHYNTYKTSPDETVEKLIAASKENKEANKQTLAEQEHREILTLFMLNQAI